MADDIESLRNEIQLLHQQIHIVSRVNSIRANMGKSGSGASVQQQPAGLAPAAVAPRGARAWRTMTAAQASEAWNELTAFVDWLLARYQLTDTLPLCWYRHGAMVEELHALHLAWNGAYLAAAARAIEPVQWHELLHRALTRLREWDRYGCAAGTHRDHAVDPADESSLEERDAFIRDDNRARAGRDGKQHVPTPAG
jgi:hypothetical protein